MPGLEPAHVFRDICLHPGGEFHQAVKVDIGKAEIIADHPFGLRQAGFQARPEILQLQFAAFGQGRNLLQIKGARLRMSGKSPGRIAEDVGNLAVSNRMNLTVAVYGSLVLPNGRFTVSGRC